MWLWPNNKTPNNLNILKKTKCTDKLSCRAFVNKAELRQDPPVKLVIFWKRMPGVKGVWKASRPK